MAAITTLVAPSGECFEVKTDMVSLQCNNCVIHTSALQRRASHNGALYKSSFLHVYRQPQLQLQILLSAACLDQPVCSLLPRVRPGPPRISVKLLVHDFIGRMRFNKAIKAAAAVSSSFFCSTANF